MKKAFIYFLIGALLAPAVLKLGIYADFKQNQEYIARVLCINKKKKTIIACNGYCQLQERLQRVDGESQDAPLQESKTDLQEWVLFFVPVLCLDTPFVFWEKSAWLGIYQSIFSDSYLLSVFRPPSFSV